MGAIRVCLEGDQVEWIMTALPAMKDSADDPEVTAGTCDVAGTAIEIHPDQTNPGFPTEGVESHEGALLSCTLDCPSWLAQDTSAGGGGCPQSL
jgi:hypothetical protein